MPAQSAPPDYSELAALMKALAYPARLELLGILRTPQTLGEIRLTPHRQEPGEVSDRPAARQTVQGHLDQLADAGLLRVEAVERVGREMPLYAANPARLYALVEELRALVVHYAGRGLGPEHTATVGGWSAASTASGPRLVLVHGVYEGRVYQLGQATAHAGGWTIGREKGLPICLDYDPFVSHASARVTHEDDGFYLTDLGSKNGTWLNWARLGAEETRPLRAADVVGVGRSLLVFAPQ